MEFLMDFLLRDSITIILQLVFMGCFLFLYIKTKSKGVILIWITLLVGRIEVPTVIHRYRPYGTKELELNVLL